MKIFFKKSIVSDVNLSDRAIAVYIALRKIYTSETQQQFVSINYLLYILTKTVEHTHRFIDNVMLGLNELIDTNLVNIIGAYSKTDFVLDLSALHLKNNDGYFGIVNDDELEKIMACSGDKFKLLRYYLVLIGTLVNKDVLHSQNNKIPKGVGSMTQEYLSDISGLSIRSIIRYNKILVEQELIYVYSAPDFYFSDEKIKSFSNTYGRYCDKDKIIECGNLYVQSYGFNAINNKTLIKKTASSYSRSMSNKFRYIRDKGKTYDYETMKAVYLAMIEQNQKIKTRFFKNDDYEKYKKDLTLFKEFDFYIQ